MTFRELEPVVLKRNLPKHGLRKGDLGAVVILHGPDRMDVEFVSASGKTQAIVTLKAADVRRVNDEDLVAVRSTRKRKASALNGRRSGRAATSA